MNEQRVVHTGVKSVSHVLLSALLLTSSSDGYSTIDQRDKECKYKTSDGSADLTEREPLKVQRPPRPDTRHQSLAVLFPPLVVLIRSS